MVRRTPVSRVTETKKRKDPLWSSVGPICGVLHSSLHCAVHVLHNQHWPCLIGQRLCIMLFPGISVNPQLQRCRNAPGWRCTNGIFFLGLVLTKVVGRLTLVSFHFSALISVFVLELFFFPARNTVFFPFETSLPPTYSHLPIPLTYTFKFKIDSLSPTYSPIYLKYDALIPIYLPTPPKPIYLCTYPPIYLTTYEPFR